MPNNMIIASHRRSGTHLTIDSILHNFDAYKNNPSIDTLTLDHLSEHVKNSNQHFENFKNTIKQKNVIMKTHSHGHFDRFFKVDRESTEYLNDLFACSKVIYVFRDGRDVLISQYHYQKQFDPAMNGKSFQAYIREKNNFDRLTYDGDKNRVEYWAYHIDSWLGSNKLHCLFLSFEEFQQDYTATLKKISEFIQLPLNKRIIDIRISQTKAYTKWQKFIERMTKREIQRTSVCLRKGLTKQWPAYYRHVDLTYFNRYAGQKLIKLNYIQ